MGFTVTLLHIYIMYMAPSFSPFRGNIEFLIQRHTQLESKIFVKVSH